MRDLVNEEVQAVQGGCFYLPVEFDLGLDPVIIICPPPPKFEDLAL